MKTLEKLFKTMPQAIIIGQAHSLGYARQVERLRTIKDCKQFIKDYKERSEAHSIKFICEDERHSNKKLKLFLFIRYKQSKTKHKGNY